MAFELRLEDRKWSVALAFGLAFGLAVAGAVHYFWLRGLNEEIRTKRTELEGLQQEIQKGRAAERQLARFREEIKRLEIDLSKLLQILPSKRNTEDLIKRIEALTRQGDFNLKRFAPGEFANKSFYSEWPIDIQLDGTYHNLALFFDRMSRFSRIINVEEMKISAVNDATRSIAAGFTAKTFIYTGESDTGKAGAGKPGAAGGAAAKAQGLKAKSEAGMKE
jgi:type IV pilus assembly protein PilO